MRNGTFSQDVSLSDTIACLELPPLFNPQNRHAGGSIQCISPVYKVIEIRSKETNTCILQGVQRDYN